MEKNKLIISILKKILAQDELETEEIEKSIDRLEEAKSSVAAEDDETIDKMDELQDYFEYLLTANKPFDIMEIKQEIANLIKTLEK